MNVHPQPVPAFPSGDPRPPTPTAAPTPTPTSTPTPTAAPTPTPTLTPTWTEDLLRGEPSPGWASEARRLALGVGLAVLFGAAIGLRRGGPAIFTHALGVPAGILAVCLLAVPAFSIVLALANAPIDAYALGRATTRAAAHAGLVLGGFAPAAALFVVTVEDAITVTVMGFGALLLAGAIAARSFAREIAQRVEGSPPRTRYLAALCVPAFLVFSAVLSLRVFWITLPILTGAQ